jgi:glycine/D-amino acid oxidase-like deaminating enzyme
MRVCDVAIAGGGIVGAACAAECAAAKLKVVVVEAGVIGGGATAAGMGHLVVMDDSPAQLALTAYSCRLWAELHPTLPAEVEYATCGTIWIAADEEEMAEVRRKKCVYDAASVGAEILGSQELAEAEPNLHPGLAGGLLVTGDAVIYPPCVARYLLDRARAQGASVRSGFAADLTNEGIRLRDGSFIAAGFTVDATGAWSHGVPGLPVRMRKGHLAITDRYPGYVRHQLVELGYLKSAHSSTGDSVAFNVQPRKTGQVLIGSSRQYGAENAAVEQPILRCMLQRAIEYMPGLANLSAIRAWTGFRAATPDKLPLIGPAPGSQRLYLANGHEGLGITTSVGTAKLLVDQFLGRTPAIPIEPYLPSRHHG